MKPVEKIEIQLVDTQSLLFGFDLSSQKSQLDLAKIAVNELKVSNPEKRTSNIYGEWHSPMKAHLINEKLQLICKLVTNICGQI